jgi:hypothetical protein
MITIDAILTSKVLALSLKEPFGTLMLPPHNKIETRTWSTNYRGLVMICCSKVGYAQHQILSISGEKQFDSILSALSRSLIYGVYFGKAIAVGRLIECRPMKKEDEDKCFVQYFPDLFCHVYEEMTPITPLPWKGSQGWKEVDKSYKELIIIKS